MVFREHGHESSLSTRCTVFCDYKKQLCPAKLRIVYPLGYYNQNYIKRNSDYWEKKFSRRVSKNLRTTDCFVQRNGGWAQEEFKRSRWVNEPWMFKSACSNYRSLPINQLVAAWTAQYIIISNTIPPPAVWLLSTAQWLVSPYKYSQTRLKRHRFMRHLAYSVRYSVVQINSC